MFTVLRNGSFRLLWASSLAIQVGYWFVTITFQWLLPHSTDSDGILLGLLFFCTFIPFLLFSLPAGALADNRDRRTILVTSQIAATALAVTCLVLSATRAMPPIVVLCLGFIGGCIVVVVSPANQALTANVVPQHNLADAISLQSVALNVARISGPTLAGPILLAAGATAAFAVYALTSILALLMLSRIRGTRAASRTSAEPMLKRVRHGFEHARARRPTLRVLAIVAIASVFGCAFQAQLPVLGARVAADGDTAFLVLVVAAGVGSLIGVTAVARLDRLPTSGSIAAGLTALGGCVAAMGSVRSFPLMIALLVVAGAAIFWVMTCANIVIQHLVDDDQRGRVMSLYFLCWGGLLPFGGLGLGSSMSLMGSPAAFAAFGAIAVIGGAVLWWRSARPLQDATTGDGT